MCHLCNARAVRHTNVTHPSLCCPQKFARNRQAVALALPFESLDSTGPLKRVDLKLVLRVYGSFRNHHILSSNNF